MTVDKHTKLSRKLSTIKTSCSEDISPEEVIINDKSADITTEESLITNKTGNDQGYNQQIHIPYYYCY